MIGKTDRKVKVVNIIISLILLPKNAIDLPKIDL